MPTPRHDAHTPGRARLSLSERDLAVLELAAEHRAVQSAQIARLLAVSEGAARARLARLAAAGLLRAARPYDRQPRIHQITAAGLRATGSALAPPRLGLALLRHDLGLGWLWPAARDGAFGPLRELYSERAIRSREGGPGASAPPDASAPSVAERLAVRAGGYGPRGGRRLHHPDLVFLSAGGRRVAVELELSSKGGARLERIIARYAADPAYDLVIYLTDEPRIAERVRAAARRAGCADLVRVALVEFSPGRLTLGEAQVAVRAPARAHATQARGV
jgi:DNA-binding MarR family transcriptional regulator